MRPILAWILFVAWASAAPMSVTDTKGRSIEIDLLEFADDTVTFTTGGKRKEHQLAIDRFDEASQISIRQAAKTLKPRFPKLEMDVVIGKRRKKSPQSYYMMDQTVTSKIEIRNSSRTITMPKTKGKIVFIGRGRRTGESYKVLAAQEFEASAEPGKKFEFVPKTFITSYDSDNRGSWNAGGYQYDSYVVALLDDQGNAIIHKTSDPSIRSLLDSHLIMASTIVSYPVGTMLLDDMTKEPTRVGR